MVLCFHTSKQNSLWAEGDVFREKMQNERENGKASVTRILSGVDDISINGSNKNRASNKEETVSLFLFWRSRPRCSFRRTDFAAGFFCFVLQDRAFCLFIAVSLCSSTTTMRRETASRRGINCEP